MRLSIEGHDPGYGTHIREAIQIFKEMFMKIEMSEQDFEAIIRKVVKEELEKMPLRPIQQYYPYYPYPPVYTPPAWPMWISHTTSAVSDQPTATSGYMQVMN